MATPKSTDRISKFCFTLNNYTPQEYEAVLNYRNFCKFLVVGKEVGANGTPHLQGFATLSKQCRFSAIKKALPRAHLEKAKGTDEQNLAYCTKDDKQAFVFGEPQRVGKRNDLDKACAAIIQKKPMDEVALENPVAYVKFHRGLQALASQTYKPRDVNDPPTVLWIWGPAGVGKTRCVWDNFPRDNIYPKDRTPWWDNYRQQDCILIDDFSNTWHFQDFLVLIDRYPYQAQIKGGYVHINSPFIIITCEFPPDHFWQHNDLAQVVRRLSHIFGFT